jgi:preprotein translocase subunit SecG
MLELLQTPLTVLHIIVCLFLVLIVLIQPGKSGGIGAALGGAGAQQVFGGRGAGNFLSKLTWASAGTFFLTSMTLAYLSSSTGDSLEARSGTVEAQDLPTKSQAQDDQGAGSDDEKAESDDQNATGEGAGTAAANEAESEHGSSDSADPTPADGNAAPPSPASGAPAVPAPNAPAAP